MGWLKKQMKSIKRQPFNEGTTKISVFFVIRCNLYKKTKESKDQMWRFARFGSIRTILKTCKIHMDDCNF